MEKRVVSLETQIALIQQEIVSIQTKEISLPIWLKTVAITSLGALFLQTIAVVWWAATITNTVNNISGDVQYNTKFRLDFPMLHEEVMVELGSLKIDNSNIKDLLREVRSSFVGTHELRSKND